MKEKDCYQLSNDFCLQQYCIRLLLIAEPGPPSWGVPTKTSTVTPHNVSKNPFQQRISAKTHGTKYHNPRPETNWREAKTEDGNIYYWNLTSHGKERRLLSM